MTFKAMGWVNLAMMMAMLVDIAVGGFDPIAAWLALANGFCAAVGWVMRHAD